MKYFAYTTIIITINCFLSTGEKDYAGYNGKRLVEVWLDDYKHLFYIYKPLLKVGGQYNYAKLNNLNHKQFNNL